RLALTRSLAERPDRDVRATGHRAGAPHPVLPGARCQPRSRRRGGEERQVGYLVRLLPGPAPRLARGATLLAGEGGRDRWLADRSRRAIVPCDGSCGGGRVR